MTSLEMLQEAVVVAACVAAAIGCFVLDRRIRRLASTERGIGKALTEMSRSVGQFEKLLVAAEESTREASTILDEQLAQARKLLARLETLGGAAPRSVAPKAPQNPAAAADPLADVAPKAAPVAAPAAQAAAGRAESNGTAQVRLANLAERHASIAKAAAGAGRSPQV
jgi:hypothetical protein